MSILAFVKQNYLKDDEKLWFFLNEIDEKTPISSHTDFAAAIIAYEKQKDPEVNEMKSSSFAVCNEYIGYATAYSRSRAGVWNVTTERETGELKIITMREILEKLKNTHINRVTV